MVPCVILSLESRHTWQAVSGSGVGRVKMQANTYEGQFVQLAYTMSGEAQGFMVN